MGILKMQSSFLTLALVLSPQCLPHIPLIVHWTLLAPDLSAYPLIFSTFTFDALHTWAED